MATKLGALLKLQGIEHQLAQVRRRLGARRRGVVSQQQRVEDLQAQLEALHENIIGRRRVSDECDLELRAREERVVKLRGQLQTAKTNKEYSTLLTQINTLKADNAKLEEESLKFVTEIDALKQQEQALKEQIEGETRSLEEARSSTQEEIDRLNGMLEQLQQRRDEAAQGIDPHVLSQFQRVAETYNGEGMAPIETHGAKPPHSYICGGCFMSLTAEHANALRVHDEIRTCDSCGRILYLEDQVQA